MDPGASIFGGAATFGKKLVEKSEQMNIFGSSGASSNLFKPDSKSIFGSDSSIEEGGSSSKSGGSFLFGKKVSSSANELKPSKNEHFEKPFSVKQSSNSESAQGAPPTAHIFRQFGSPHEPPNKNQFDKPESSIKIKSEPSFLDPTSRGSFKNVFSSLKSSSKKTEVSPPSFLGGHLPSIFALPQEKKEIGGHQLPSTGLKESLPLFQPPESVTKVQGNIFKLEDTNLFKSKKSPFSFKAQASVPPPSFGNSLSDQERYETLTARNAQLRKSNESEGKDALIGDCPDMCPETERYRRSYQNQLRIYERRRDGSANHKAIVKEYSRSSADQDVPLSSELRPGKVLSRTMDHILCNIVDRIDVNRGPIYDWFDFLEENGTSKEFKPLTETKDDIGEWFEFLWSATRAIRKDITQQRLVNLEAVDLVEKCARFHIVCSERLVEAESKDFSLKLNDENLTKCLQTLQHLYYDLGLEGTACPNEPEFRSYEILMNANNGDVLRRVSTLNNEVRRSEPVRFGLKVVYALHSNNYVRFFKLMDQATLLQSCILLRYFNQVRSKALETMVKAFCPSKIETQFELSSLTNILGFEDENEATEFLVAHGVTLEDDLVFLNKNNFMFPEEAPYVRRPLNKIESKKKTDWSLVIHGGSSLPPNPYINYVPHDSFKEDGTLIKPFLNEDSDLRLLKLKAMQEKEVQLQAQRREAMLAGVSNEIGDRIIEEVCHEESLQIGNEVIFMANKINKESELIFSAIVDEVIEETIQNGLKEALNDEINRRLRMENELSASVELLDNYMDEFVPEFCLSIAKEEMEIVQKELRLKHLIEESNVLIEDMIQDYVRDNCKDIALKLIQEAESERDYRIQSLIQRREKRLLRNFFKTWKLLVVKEKKRRKTLDNFPSTPCLFKTSKSQNDKFSSASGSLSAVSLSEVVQSMKCTDNLFKYAELEDDFYHRTLLEPLDFPSLILPFLPDEDPILKVVVSCGDLNEESYDKMFFEIIKKKYSYKPHADDELLLTRYISERGSVIVRVLTHDNLMREVFYDDMARKRYLNGTTGLIFFVSSEESGVDAKDRMRVLLKNLPQSSGIPMVILSNAPPGNDIFFELKEMCKNDNISSFKSLHFSDDPFDLDTPLRILDAMKFIAQHYPTNRLSVSLKSENIRSYLDSVINDWFYKDITFDLRSQKDQRNPMILIEFYNSLIDFLIGQMRKQKFQNISWPVSEISHDVPIYWNDDTYKDKVIEVLNYIKLPMIPDPDEVGRDWGAITALVLKYFNSLTRCYGSTTPFASDIRRILLKSYNVNGSSSSIQWAQIINTVIEYKLSLADTSDPFDDSQDSKRELVIVVDEKSPSIFTPPDTWVKLNRRDPFISALTNSFSQQNEDSSDNYSILKDSSLTIQKEVEASKTFEKKLMEALDSYKEDSANEERYENSSIDGVSEYHEDDSEFRNLYEKEYVPMVSYLSPSLGAAVSPHNVTKRLEIVMTGKSPNFSSRRTRIVEKRKIDQVIDSKENISFYSKKMSIDRMLESLQSKVSGSLNDSRNFDDKLLNATLSSEL